MDWDCFRYFLAVVEHKSLSAAARELGVTQPTVGRRIRDLENWLDARLFDRENLGYSLTPAGETIVELAYGLDKTVGDIIRRVSGHDGRRSGRVRLSTAECLGTFWLVPRLSSFKGAFPEIELEIILNNNALDVMSGHCDIALRVGDPESEDAIGQCFGKVHFGLFASSAYLAANGTPTALSDLQQHSVIAWAGADKDVCIGQLVKPLAGIAKMNMLCNSMTALLAAGRSGLGVVVLPLYVAATQSDLTRILPEAVNHSEDLWLLTHKDLTKTAKVRAVMSYLADLVRREADSLLSAEALGPSPLPEEHRQAWDMITPQPPHAS
ncbi:LysR family transcriptional regulator [Pelagibius sp.]|uniref:LysR family transcriptional regulator n=1 Tax=Pelagibius sp. TaxID=1931238 RepID=UPI00262DE649|nr:LysR family transcriptional regulator [Pelagibius sp.]